MNVKLVGEENELGFQFIELSTLRQLEREVDLRQLQSIFQKLKSKK